MLKAEELRRAADDLPDMDVLMSGLSAMLNSYPGILREHADLLERVARLEAALRTARNQVAMQSQVWAEDIDRALAEAAP